MTVWNPKREKSHGSVFKNEIKKTWKMKIVSKKTLARRPQARDTSRKEGLVARGNRSLGEKNRKEWGNAVEGRDKEHLGEDCQNSECPGAHGGQ